MSTGLGNIALGVGRSAGKSGNGNVGKAADIIDFAESAWGVEMELYPVQRVILKCHYGIPLDDTKEFLVDTSWRLDKKVLFTEASYLRYLYDEGRSNIREVIPGQERREMVLSIGRRSGKTMLSAAIAAYETYKLILKGDPHSYYGIMPSNPIQIISIATDKDQAGILYQDVSGHFRACDFFGPYTANNTMSYARFQTPKDIDKYGRYSQDPTARASLRVTFRSCIAKGLRGAGNIVIIMDEAAHFTDGGQSSAASVYDAVTPSAATFSPKDPKDKKVPIGKVEGRVISISSPLGKQGHFYQLYQLGYTGTAAADNMLCIQAPTWEVNPTLPISEYEKFYYKDPNVFFTEFGGQFTDRTRGWLEREEDLLMCVEPSLHPQVQAPARLPHFIGIDVGLVKDASAVAIGHMEIVDGQNKVVVDLVDQIKAGEGKYKDQARLDFDGVADWILKLSKKFYIAEGMFDQYVGIPFEQALVKRGLRQIKMVHMTRQLNSDIFKNFKDMMWEKWLVLYDYPIPVDPKEGSHCPYILQLMELQAQYLSKYVTLVQAPQVAGKHDDMADALVRMVWQASHSLSKPKIISGVRNRNGIAGGVNPGAARRARLNARRMGSSPDRQASKANRNMTRGR